MSTPDWSVVQLVCMILLLSLCDDFRTWLGIIYYFSGSTKFILTLLLSDRAVLVVIMICMDSCCNIHVQTTAVSTCSSTMTTRRGTTRKPWIISSVSTRQSATCWRLSPSWRPPWNRSWRGSPHSWGAQVRTRASQLLLKHSTLLNPETFNTRPDNTQHTTLKHSTLRRSTPNPEASNTQPWNTLHQTLRCPSPNPETTKHPTLTPNPETTLYIKPWGVLHLTQKPPNTQPWNTLHQTLRCPSPNPETTKHPTLKHSPSNLEVSFT